MENLSKMDDDLGVPPFREATIRVLEDFSPQLATKVSVHPSHLQRHSSWTSLTWYRPPWPTRARPLPGANCTSGGPHGAEAGWILRPRLESNMYQHVKCIKLNLRDTRAVHARMKPKAPSFSFGVGLTLQPYLTEKFGLVAAHYWEWTGPLKQILFPQYSRPDAYIQVT